MTTKQVTHTLWPVTYVNEDGEQRESIYNFKPVGKDYVIGSPVEVIVQHPENVGAEHRQEAIERLERKLAVLKGE